MYCILCMYLLQTQVTAYICVAMSEAKQKQTLLDEIFYSFNNAWEEYKCLKRVKKCLNLPFFPASFCGVGIQSIKTISVNSH